MHRTLLQALSGRLEQQNSGKAIYLPGACVVKICLNIDPVNGKQGSRMRYVSHIY